MLTILAFAAAVYGIVSIVIRLIRGQAVAKGKRRLRSCTRRVLPLCLGGQTVRFSAFPLVEPLDE